MSGRAPASPTHHGVLGRGFTLAELIVSVAAMAVLMGALMSALLIAIQALPERDASRDGATSVAEGLDSIVRDLAWAVSVTKYGAIEADFSTEDRGHGGAGPETVRYAWSGVAGDPLTRVYNGGKETVLVDQVADFEITWTTETGPVTSVPRVLLMIADSAIPLADDAAKQALLQFWDMTVQVVTDTASLASFQALMANVDVLYVSEEVNTTNAADLFYNTTRGVVIEPSSAIGSYGFVLLPLTASDSAITLSDTTHPVTSVFSSGVSYTITTSAQPLNANTALLLAPGTRTLALQSPGGGLSPVTLAVLDVGSTQIDGSKAQGRRVALPWGGALLSNFQFSTLREEGRTLLRRSLAWAAAPIVMTRARIRIQSSDDRVGTLETEVRLLNCPRMPGA